MTMEPTLAIDWTGATEADKVTALAAINAGFTAIGMTAAHGAMASSAREGDELDFMVDETSKFDVTSEQHDAADMWDDMETTALIALGKDPPGERLPGFVGWIEPWVSAESAKEAVRNAA